jgi:Spy/CpxP family protein refolding chaperone
VLYQKEDMMRKTKSITIIAALIILGALLVVGCTQRAHRRFHDSATEYISKTLELNEAQNVKLKDVVMEVNSKGRELCLSKRTIDAEVGKQIKSDTFDAEALKAVIGVELEKINRTTEEMVEQFAEFHTTLVHEQKERLRELIDKLYTRSHRRSQDGFCERIAG